MEEAYPPIKFLEIYYSHSPIFCTFIYNSDFQAGINIKKCLYFQ
ncbi:hypothetical protein DSUL_30104 [Desulfovibrionales bacterium]